MRLRVDEKADCMFCPGSSGAASAKMLDRSGYWTWICASCLREALKSIRLQEPMVEKVAKTVDG